LGELALYRHDAGIVPKGILMEEFGFIPETCRPIAAVFPLERYPGFIRHMELPELRWSEPVPHLR
jgi:hypothetical protein